MSFFEYKNNFNPEKYKALAEKTTAEEIFSILEKEKISFTDYLKLLSKEAENHLEKIAEKSRYLTQLKFGKTIQLYSPLYVSNKCINTCLYCAFNAKNKINRKTLTIPEIEKEALYLKKKRFSNILLVSSENLKEVTVSYLIKVVKALKKDFSSISFEIYPLETKDYNALVLAGTDGLAIYQETYNEEIYSKMHPSGKKRNYKYRLETPERAIAGGIKKISIGSLLGLNDFYNETFYLGLHIQYLIKKYWDVFFSVSFPRIKDAPKDFSLPNQISDRKFVQLICAIRLFCPEIGLNLSTRETSKLRDNLINIGITSMSAGSKTNPGGYNVNIKTNGQFEVYDNRTAEEIYKLIQEKGYQPVFKDWDKTININ